MRPLHLTAALAAALALSGCFVSASDGTANVYWAFRRSAPAQPGGFLIYDETYAAPNATGVCPESAVDTVRVASAAGTFDIACTGPTAGGGYVQGAVVDFLPVGRSTITLTGLRGGQAVYRSSVEVNASSGPGTDVYVDVFGLSAPLEVYAYLLGGVPPIDYLDCAEALSPNLTVELFDAFGHQIDGAVAGCSDPLPAFAFAEQVDLDDYTVRVVGRRVGSGALLFDSCDLPLDHFGPQVGVAGFTADLFTAPIPTCP